MGKHTLAPKAGFRNGYREQVPSSFRLPTIDSGIVSEPMLPRYTQEYRLMISWPMMRMWKILVGAILICLAT